MRSSAGIAVFVGPADDKAGWIAVGRSYERFALQATALGVRTAHLNQPVEVAALRPSLSHLPDSLIEIIRRSLQGETFVPLAQAFEITRSRPHGHVQAVSAAMQRLGFASLVASEPSRQRDLVLAMVACRIVQPHTKLATTRWWHTTMLAEDLGVAGAGEDELCAAMDWLLARQDRVQKKLASRHLHEGGQIARWPGAATAATARPARCRSTTGS